MQVSKTKEKAKDPELIVQGRWLKGLMDKADVSNITIADELELNYPNLVSQWRTGETSMPDVVMLWLGKRLGGDPILVRPSLQKYSLLIAGSPILQDLTPEDLEDVAEYAEYRRLRAAQPTIKQQSEYTVDLAEEEPRKTPRSA